MSKVELLRELYEYNEWANGVILEAAVAITEDELGHKQTASHESIQGLLAHTLAAQVFWLTRWKGEPFTGFPQVREGRALESLRESYATSDADLREFADGLVEVEMERPTAMPEWDERMKGVDLPLWQVMMQIPPARDAPPGGDSGRADGSRAPRPRPRLHPLGDRPEAIMSKVDAIRTLYEYNA